MFTEIKAVFKKLAFPHTTERKSRFKNNIKFRDLIKELRCNMLNRKNHMNPLIYFHNKEDISCHILRTQYFHNTLVAKIIGTATLIENHE
jgi:hypothetical protein